MWQGFPEAPKHSSLVSMLLGSSTSPANVLTRLLTSCRYWVMVYVVCASRVLTWFGIFWGLYLNQIEAVDRWYLDVIIKHWGAGTRSISFPKEKKNYFFFLTNKKLKMSQPTKTNHTQLMTDADTSVWMRRSCAKETTCKRVSVNAHALHIFTDSMFQLHKDSGQPKGRPWAFVTN